MLGNMGDWWERKFGLWVTKYTTFKYTYQENTLTGNRRAKATGNGGYQPMNTRWLNGGEWESDRPPPPSFVKNRSK